MGKVLAFQKPNAVEREIDTKERIRRISDRLDSINSCKEAIKKNIANELHLEQERIINNKKVLDSYRIRRKSG
jgi:hypothetical protein